ncbi:MAG: lysophospholipid acyltransferase family protein [Hyphomicrobiaceae bacterium]|nr:lysophospholipid acyltransferase family protein [Hyphomicrobiaceae bacterium]
MLIVRSYLFAAAFYVTTALFLLLGFWLLLAPRRWAMEGLRLHGLASLWLLKHIAGTRMEVRGHQHVPQGACLIVAKHQSAWDTFALVPLFRDPAIVLKDELKWIPFYGWFCVKFEHILVKRDRAAVALKALVEAGKVRIAQDRQVVIFPEGTRRTPGAPPDYKPGYVALYEGLGVPCIPLALNSGLFWPRRSLLRFPGTIVVEFLEPIPAGMPRKTFKAELEKRLEDASNRLVSEGLAKSNGEGTVLNR